MPLTILAHTYSYIYIYYTFFFMSRDSSVGIASGYGLYDWMIGVRFPAGAGNVSLRHVQTGSGTHPASYPMVPGSLSLGVKRSVREADHSPPSSAEVKERVELYLHSQYAFIAWCSVKALRQLYLFYLYLSP
jgi:hypothetical protein